MIPTQALLDKVASAIAADTTALAAAGFLHVYLVKAPFTPGPNLVVADVPKADFTGATAIVTASAVIGMALDPETGEWILQVPEVAGGWHWQTGDLVNLPQTIYGYALTNVGETVLWGTAIFDAPILLNGDDQGIDIGQVRFRLANSALS